MLYKQFHEPARAGKVAMWAAVLLAALSAVPAQAQCLFSCKTNLQVSLDPVSGEATISPKLIAPDVETYCLGSLSVELLDPWGQMLPNPLTCAEAGLKITAKVTNTVTGNNCSGSLTLRDATPPALSCPDLWVDCSDATGPYDIGFAEASDNCGAAQPTHTDTEVSLPCGTVQSGFPVSKRIDRRWTARDAAGNSATCIQRIWVKKADLSAVTFPPDLSDNEAPALDCSENPADLNRTGRPLFNGAPLQNNGPCKLSAFYTDQLLQECPPAGFAILRTWTVMDDCSSSILRHLQIIRIVDRTPPVVVPPANITVAMNGLYCTGSVQLRKATVFDNCDAPPEATPSWKFGSGFGPFNNVTEGTHVVTYTAQDKCGNIGTATATVTVKDGSPPQAICQAALQISLSANGQAAVSATAVNAGSFDNCSPVSTAVSRDEVNYAPMVVFGCADAGTPHTVSLRVRDNSGLENFCETTVTIRDLLKPGLVCPIDITLNCRQDYQDQSLTGTVQASDNCGLQSLNHSDVANLDACKIGTVVRSWTAADQAGNTRQCSQTIQMAPVNGLVVSFPPNLTINACGSNSDWAPAATGVPQYSGAGCSVPSVTHQDEIFPLQSAVCFRILRTWKVVDFCLYSPANPGVGYWEAIQIIDVTDQRPPELSLVPEIIAVVPPGSCQAAVVIPAATAADCGKITALQHNSAYAAAAGADASGMYPPGLHLVTFTAADDCGNSTQSTVTINVLDNTAPKPLCQENVSVALSASGAAVLDARAFDKGSGDLCTPASELIFSVTPAAFNCSKLGVNPVVLMIRDAQGNEASCLSAVTILDTGGACSSTQLFNLSGRIVTEDNKPIGEIPVHLTAAGLRETTEADALGRFLFEDMPSGTPFSIRPALSAKWLNGVSTYDLVLISKHILGLETFNTPYKLIAADANGSGSVTGADIVRIRQNLLGILDTIPGGHSWRFVPAGFVFPNPENPFDPPFPEQLDLAKADSNLTRLDFVGIKIGDINGSVDAADPRSPGDTVFLQLPHRALRAGAWQELPLRLPDWARLEGFQCALRWNAAWIDSVEIVYPHPDILNETHTRLYPGALLLSWDGNGGPDSTLLKLRFRAKSAGAGAQLFQLDNRLRPEAYPEASGQAAVLSLKIDRSPAAPILKILPPQPNPFCEQTELPFQLAAGGPVTLQVSDLAGRVILRKKADFSAGWQRFVLTRSDVPQAGLYAYRLETAGPDSVYGRFVRICP